MSSAKSSPVKHSSPTLRKRYESKENAIIQAAYDNFADKGFAKSTIADIAKAAGVAEGTVYLYFNNKDAIASAVIASFYDRLTRSTKAGVERLGSTHDKLEFMANHHLKSVLSERRILELLSVLERHEKSDHPNSLFMMNKQYVAIFDRIVHDGVLQGDISTGYTPWIVRDIFYGGLEYAMRTIMLTGRNSEVKKFSRELVRMVIGPVSAGKTHVGEETVKKSENQLLKIADRLDAIADRMDKTIS